VFVSFFQAAKLTQSKWKMPSLNDFIAALTQEQSKLVSMGAIQHSKHQALAASKGKDKQKEKGKNPDPSEERSSQFSEESSEPKGMKTNERKLCSYCSKGYHFEDTCMQRQIDEMAKLLQQHNLTVPKHAKKRDEDKPRGVGHLARNGYALCAFLSPSSLSHRDSGPSHHMVATKEPLSSPKIAHNLLSIWRTLGRPSLCT